MTHPLGSASSRPHSPGFLRKWVKTRVLAEAVLEGPRSIAVKDTPRGSEEWLEPVFKVLKRRLSPLMVETQSVFCLPTAIQDSELAKVPMVRYCCWRGEEDKRRCKSESVEFPSVNFKHSVIPADQIHVLDKVLRTVDEGFMHIPFAIEGLGVEAELAFTQSHSNQVATSGSHIFRMWRRIRYQELKVGWHEADESCLALTNLFRESWERLGAVKLAYDQHPGGQYRECYDVGSDPGLLKKWLEAETTVLNGSEGE
jgi:hypothetical protein